MRGYLHALCNIVPVGSFLLGSLDQATERWNLRNAFYQSDLLFWRETGRTIWWEGDLGISLWQGLEPSIWQNYYVYDWPRLGKYLCDSLSDTDKGSVNGIAKALRLVLLPKQMQGESKAWFYRTLCLEHALWGFAFLQLYWGLDRVFHKKQGSFLWPGDLNLAVSIYKETIYQKSEFYLKNWPIAP